MKKEEFEKIENSLENYQHTSLMYTEYEDVKDYEIVIQTSDVIVLCGYDTEAKEKEYHWAANAAKDVVQLITEPECMITFVPKEWVAEFEQAGFVIRNAWHDYFIRGLEKIEKSFEMPEFLQEKDCAEASELTMTCRGKSRGFTGQTTEWFEKWMSQEGDEARERAVFVKRNASGEIVGLVCTGVYGEPDETIVWIREVAVRPDYQNKGIGRTLITQALNYGKEHGAVKAFLAADEQNSGAIHLYESLGFVASCEESQIDMRKSVSCSFL